MRGDVSEWIRNRDAFALSRGRIARCNAGTPLAPALGMMIKTCGFAMLCLLGVQGAGSSELAVAEPPDQVVDSKRERGGRRVKPGLVHWHADFAAAKRAAAKSGRPVLLFQLLGRLDEEFC